MTNLAESRQAADNDRDASNDSMRDRELTSLVRRWMAAGGKAQGRVRRDTALRLAPEPPPVQPDEVEPPADLTEVAADDAVDVEVDVEVAAEVAVEVSPADDAELPALPRLPRRPAADEAEQVQRVALLIDARRIPADVATALLARLAERGTVNVCRAYADWNGAGRDDWVAHLRREGLHSFHHFADDDDQALVAMTIDAVDIARDAAVDEVVIAGDLTSALPLVHRLHAAGVRVVAVGSGLTPHDVRAAAHEFIDTGSLDGEQAVPAGRHRA